MASHQAEQLKEKGNAAFRNGEYLEAEDFYTQAVAKYSKNPLLFTNRANARLKLQRWDGAVNDCLKSIEVTGPNGQNHKAFYFLAQAQLALHHPHEALSSALTAYEQVLHPAPTAKISPRDLETFSAFVLKCKKAKFAVRDRERLRRHGDLRAELEESLEAQRQRELSNVSQQLDRKELGQVEASERGQEIMTNFDSKVNELRAVFAAADPANYKPREIPDHLVDMITFEPMHDPVITKMGHSYERATIYEHLKRSPTDPLTRDPLTVGDLRTNFGLKAACEEFWESGATNFQSTNTFPPTSTHHQSSVCCTIARKKCSPTGVRYHNCNKTRLASFIADRGLQVINTAKKHHIGPTHADYVRALKKADSATHFRFLNLSPELRNTIYEELLILQNSFSCTPQILATCKQINKEATSVLYGDNLIEAKIYPDGIIAHGRRCGTYVPASFHPGRSFSSLIWPSYLRRVQHLNITTISLPFWGDWLIPLSNTVFSLCSFLGADHDLRSLQLDLRWFASHDVTDQIGFVLHSLRLLGPVPRVQIHGFGETVTSRFIAEMDPSKGDHAMTSARSTASEIASCIETFYSLARSVPVLLPSRHRDTRMTKVLHELSQGLTNIDLGRGVAWEKEFLDHLNAARVRYEEMKTTDLGSELRKALEDVLLKGVDVRSRQITLANAY